MDRTVYYHSMWNKTQKGKRFMLFSYSEIRFQFVYTYMPINVEREPWEKKGEGKNKAGKWNVCNMEVQEGPARNGLERG